MSIEINGGEDFLAGRPANKAATGGPAQAGTAPKLASQKQLLAMQAQQKALLARSAKARQLRARFDDRSTDKTYRSADVSAIGEQTVADTTLKPGQKPKPAAFRQIGHLDERNTDRYYRDNLVRGKTKQQLEHEARRRNAPPVLRRGRVQPLGHSVDPGQLPASLDVMDRGDIRPVAETVRNLLNQGQGKVMVRVVGPAILAMQFASLLDGMVGREEITEDRRRDVIIGTATRLPGTVEETRSVEEMLGKPEDMVVQDAVEVDDGDFDPEAFLASDDEDEETLPPEMPVNVVHADTGDDDSDFLEAPVPSQASTDLFAGEARDEAFLDAGEDVVPAAQPAQPAQAQPRQGRKKKRR